MIQAHQGPIVSLLKSADNTKIFSFGRDGAIFTFKVGEQMFNIKDKTFKPIQ